MRRLNYEGDYNLIFEKQRKYEEGLKSYHDEARSKENHHLEEKEDEKKENENTPE
ncbi:MAG: hypothetical protein J5629_05470 [Muribaculaceae bacterium]|nr:hypothetical protein [Muribaculaceae bacterium]